MCEKQCEIYSSGTLYIGYWEQDKFKQSSP